MVVLWYDNEVTQGILKKKYLHEGEETFEDLVNRVSSIYSEDIKEDVKTAMMNADLSPAGRTLYAAGMKGKGKKLTGSNCFVLGNVKKDTLESISEIDYEVARIGSCGGGVGLDAAGGGGGGVPRHRQRHPLPRHRAGAAGRGSEAGLPGGGCDPFHTLLSP